MKKNLQKMQVKAINKRAILESHDGEEFSLITVAKNVLCEDGTTMQDYFDSHSEPNISTKIVNSNSMSKVGQGDNVDFSDNVMNGAYEDVVLKGKSLVNVIQEPSSQDVVLPYTFEDGQYVTINDTKESGALGVELKGQTLVNIFQFTSKDDFVSSNALIIEGTAMKFNADGSYQNFWLKNNGLVKANTNYLFILDILENTLVYKDGTKDTDTVLYLTSAVSGSNDSNFFQHGAVIVVSDLKGSTKRFIKKMTSNPTSTGTETLLTRGFLSPNAVSGTLKIKLMIIEYQDGMENWDIPYFEGMQSVKMPILHTVGSLFDAQQIIPNNTFTYSHSTNTGRFEFTNRGDVVANTNIQLPAGTYDISFLVRGVCDNGRVAITFAKDGEAWHGCSRIEVYYGHFGSTTFKEVKSTRTFDAPVTVTLVGHAWAGGETGSGWCELKDIRFTPVGKTSILSLPEEVVLRSLPNGVCDTFNTRTGVYTQRVYETTITGTGDWVQYDTSNTNRQETIAFSVNLGLGDVFDNDKTYSRLGGVICDKLNHINSVWGSDKDIEGISADQRNVIVQIKKTRLASEDVTGFKAWLASNNLKVGIQLATPIVTKINLLSTLKPWNTTTHIYSEIPENTLYPILSHSNPSYPVILKPSTKYSIVANSYSNSHTNSTINFNLGGATASTTVGNRVTTITTPSTLSNELLTMSGRGNKLNNVMVIEGDVVGDEPYFEGVCDCKSPILSNVGKNFAHIRTDLNSNGGSVDSTQVVNSSNGIVATSLVQIKGGEEYILTYNGSGSQSRYFLFKDNPLNGAISYTGQYNFPTNGTLKISTQKGDKYLFVVWTRDTVNYPITNMQIEQKSSATTYEPHKSNTTTFDQKDGKTIVLRSLPNGVCDTLNVKTGEYVQNIREITLNGSEDWQGLSPVEGNDSLVRFYTGNQLGVKPSSKVNFICDKFKMVDNAVATASGECVFNNSVSGGFPNGIQFQVLKEKATTVGEWRTYLSQNPITVQYELATPIVKQVNVEGYPYAYENGHILLESGSQEQSLTPTIEYSIVANRGGQIRSNQRMVERHQKKLDSLYAMTLVNMIDSQYKQVLMKLKSELGSEVTSWDI